MDGIKQKFDRLANEDKKTGNPNWPPVVRRAKYIARSLVIRAHAISLGFESIQIDEIDDFTDLTNNSEANIPRNTLGARKDSRSPTQPLRKKQKLIHYYPLYQS